MDSVRVDANLCNGDKSSPDFDLREVVDKEAEEEEETNSLLPSAVNGGMQRKRQKNARGKVQWNDRNGNSLVEVVEFQPNDSSDSEDEYADSCTCTIFVDCLHICDHHEKTVIVTAPAMGSQIWIMQLLVVLNFAVAWVAEGLTRRSNTNIIKVLSTQEMRIRHYCPTLSLLSKGGGI